MPKDERLEVRLTTDEKAAFTIAATKDGKTLSRWLLDLALKEAGLLVEPRKVVRPRPKPVRLDPEERVMEVTPQPIVKVPHGPVILGSGAELAAALTPVRKPGHSMCFKCAHKHPPNNDCGCSCHQEV